MRSVWAATAISVLLVAAGCGLRTSSPGEPRGAAPPAGASRTETAPSPIPEATPLLLGRTSEDHRPSATPLPPADDLGRRALLIGIDNARGASRLRGAVADAELLEKVLLDRGFPGENVTVLLDEEATRDAILSAIGEFADATSSEGRAVFAFAGHTRRRHGENHIVTADGQTITAGTLSQALSSVRAPMWVALPTCYAAGFARPGIVGPNRIATFASSATERSFESTTFGHSFLFEYMVKRFLDATGRRTSVERAFTSAKRGLERDYPRFAPVMDDQFPGEFTLRRRTAPAPRKGDRSPHRAAPEERDRPSRATPTPSPPPDKEDQPNDSHDDDDDGRRRTGVGEWKACGAYPTFGDCDRSEDQD